MNRRLRTGILLGALAVVGVALLWLTTSRRTPTDPSGLDPSAPPWTTAVGGTSRSTPDGIGPDGAGRSGDRRGSVPTGRRSGSLAGPRHTGADGAPSDRTWIERLLGAEGDVALPPEVLERWIASGRTNVEDLLAARQAGGGRPYLMMALTNFPNDPRVLLSATVLKDEPGEVQRDRLERLKTAAPENSLADYLSARDHFKNGRPEQALADLAAAGGKSDFDDYVLEAAQAAEELYREAGLSEAEAKAVGYSSVLLPHLAELKGLAQDMASLQRQYIAAGDAASAERLAQAGLQLAEHLGSGQGSHPLIAQLVGLAIERVVVSPLDPTANHPFLQGATVANYLEGVEARKTVVREYGPQFDSWIRSANDADIVGFYDRLKLHGELAALKWMTERPPGP